MLQSLAMTICVYIAELECLHDSVWRLLWHMSNHTHNFDLTQAASKGTSERSWKDFAQQHRHTFNSQIADCTRDFFDTFGSCGMQHDGGDDEVAVDERSRKRRATMCTVLSRDGRVLSSVTHCIEVQFYEDDNVQTHER